jgi:ParB-like chromosome segregation protein Spo0J
VAAPAVADAMKSSPQNESGTEMKKPKSKKSVKFGSMSHGRRKRKPTAGSERRRVTQNAVSSSNETESIYKVRHFKLADIKAKKPPGPIDPEVVERIVEGYRTHGQLMPLTVRVINKVPHLEVGFHRRAAAEKLGLKVVPCNVIRGKTVAALWRISENRDRKILTVLEQAEQMAEWFRLIEDSAPTTENEGKNIGPGRPEGAKKKALKYLPISGKTQAAKQKALDRLLKVDTIDPAVKLAIRDTALADSHHKLLQIADEPTPKAQLAKVKALTECSRKTPAKARAVESDGNEPLEVAKREFRRAKDLRRALKRLSEAECRAFLCVVLRLVLGKEEDDQREEQEHGGAEEENDDVERSEGNDAEEGDDGHDEDGDDEGDDEDEE